jgi:hypothetical protein
MLCHIWGDCVSEAGTPTGHRAAAQYMRQLLLEPGPYRDLWRQHVTRPRDGVINQLAVAEVLARHLRADPRGPGDARAEPYQLRDTVAQALTGRQFGRQTLQLFAAAFGLTDEESGRMQRLWSGSTTIRVLAGMGALPAQDERAISEVLGPHRYRVLAMHDEVGISAAGYVESLHVLQVIEAITDGVDRINFIADRNVITLEVGKGCKDLAREIRRVTGDFLLAHIVLARTLELGETLAVEYWVTWPAVNEKNPSDHDYRRAVMSHITSYDVQIQFHPNRLPTTVWWATWDGTDGDVLDRQEVALDSEHSAHRYLQSFQKTVAGFCWNLPSP